MQILYNFLHKKLWSDQVTNFAYVTTAELSWHVQICDLTE